MNKYIVCMDYTYNNINHSDVYVGIVCANSYKEAGEIIKQKIKEELSPNVTNVWIVLKYIDETLEKLSFRRYGDGNTDNKKQL